MARALIVMIVLAAILVPQACCGAGQGTSALQLCEQDSGRTLELRAGDRMDLVLFENGTTGFRWEIAAIDETIIRQTGEPEFKRDSDAMGAGGKKTFHFGLVAPGEAVLKLLYRRTWEVDVPPISTFRVTIKVAR